MSFLSILALSFGLAMDAAAVAAARGLAAKRLRLANVLVVALFFGGFQAAMPLLGWWLGRQLGPWVAEWGHWIAFALLAGIGGKMLHEVWEKDDSDALEAEADASALFGAREMFILAVATSIDAFAVGVTLPMLNAPMGLSLVTIGLTTGILSALALVAGRRFGAFLGRRLDAFGGVVLILLGLKILIEHLSAP